MIVFREIFKYLAAVIVALSVPGFGLVAFSFLAFCDRGPALVHQYSPEPITEFIISVSKWSDGTAAPTD